MTEAQDNSGVTTNVAGPTERFAGLRKATRAVVAFYRDHKRGVDTTLLASVPAAVAVSAFTPWAWAPIALAGAVAGKVNWDIVGSAREARAEWEKKAEDTRGAEPEKAPGLGGMSIAFGVLATTCLVVSGLVKNSWDSPETSALRGMIEESCWKPDAMFKDGCRRETITKINKVEHSELTSSGTVVTEAWHSAAVHAEGPAKSFWFGRPIPAEADFTSSTRSSVYSPDANSIVVTLEKKRYTKNCSTGVLTPLAAR